MAVKIVNPAGLVVEVTDDRADYWLEQDGFELAEPREVEAVEAEMDGAPDPGEQIDGQGAGPVQALSDEARADLAEALETDNYHTMRSALATHQEASTAGMGKAEVRQRIEEMLG